MRARHRTSCATLLHCSWRERQVLSPTSIDTFFGVVPRELSSSAGRLRFYMDYVFDGVTFEDKSMLDIGAGIGMFSFYAACRGASKVVCLEPETEGSSHNITGRFLKLRDALGLDQVKLVSNRFQDFDSDGDRFDILLLHNSINHLDEIACIQLLHDSAAIQTYQALFLKLSRMARPGAKIIIADCSRHNFFDLCNVRNPFAPSIEWHKHQSPECWGRLLSNAGFRNLQIRWTSFSRLGKIGRMFLGNRYAAYFLISHFCLIAEK